MLGLDGGNNGEHDHKESNEDDHIKNDDFKNSNDDQNDNDDHNDNDNLY
jgi:hypothetical protein